MPLWTARYVARVACNGLKESEIANRNGDEKEKV